MAFAFQQLQADISAYGHPDHMIRTTSLVSLDQTSTDSRTNMRQSLISDDEILHPPVPVGSGKNTVLDSTRGSKTYVYTAQGAK